jgi:hypothetical protein
MPVAYTTQHANEAFEPPCSVNAIKQALHRHELSAHRVGTKRYILTTDLIEWIATQKDYDNGR